MEHLAGHRLVYHPQDRAPILGQGDLHRKVAGFGDELGRTVHRIHDPDTIFAETAQIVLGFFAEDAIIWKGTAQARDNEGVCCSIGDGNRFVGLGIGFRLQVCEPYPEAVAVDRCAFRFEGFDQFEEAGRIGQFAPVLHAGRTAEPEPCGFDQVA